MPSILFLEGYEPIPIQGRVVIKQNPGKEHSTVVIETQEELAMALHALIVTNPIVAIVRSNPVNLGYNEIVWKPLNGDAEQISEYKFDHNSRPPVANVQISQMQEA